MARNFSVIKTNVGNNIGDTSTTTLTLIGVYVNRRYFQVLRTIKWRYINEDYTISLVAGTQDYALASDYKDGNEIYAVDTTNGNALARVTMADLGRYYPGDLTSQSTTKRYTVFTSDDGSVYFRAHPIPSTATTVAFPYEVTPAALSNDSDQPILDLEDLLEIGATADLYRRKREFGKAKDMEILFTQMLADYVWEHVSQRNRVHQFKPSVFNRDNLV